MASIPIDQHRRMGGGKPPVSAHPAFPAIVALWFAALLGLGSLIVPVQVIEQIVTATGIAGVLPSAAPPLGFTARAAIALAATIGGALLGLYAARKVAAPRSGVIATQRRDSGRRPLNPVEDLDGDGIEAELPSFGKEKPQVMRRRALAIEEDTGPSDFLNVVPLPGEDSFADDIADYDDALELDPAAEFVEGEEEFAVAMDAPHQQLQDEPEPVVQPRQEFVPVTPSVEDPQPTAGVENEEEAPAPFEFASSAGRFEPEPEPLAFSPPSLARPTFEGDEPPPEPRAFDTPAPQADEPESTFDDEPTSEETVSDMQKFDALADAADSQVLEDALSPPLAQGGDQAEQERDASIGLVQLVQKLGHTIEKHREWSVHRAEQAAATAVQAAPPIEQDLAQQDPVPQEFEAAEPDEAAEAMAAYFSRPDENGPKVRFNMDRGAPESDAAPIFAGPRAVTATPTPSAGYSPFGGAVPLAIPDDDDEDEDDISDLTASFQLPLAGNDGSENSPTASSDIAPAAYGFTDAGGDEDEEEQGYEGGYQSLSAVPNPFKNNAEDFVRIEEPESDTAQPAVLFPNEQARRPAAVVRDSVDEEPATARPFDPPAGAAAEPERRPASNDDNERALREALLNLQRMSK